MRTTPILICCFIVTLICSCSPKEKQVPESAEIENLKLQLEATENQLLNIRTELARCKGAITVVKDSLELDSVK